MFLYIFGSQKYTLVNYYNLIAEFFALFNVNEDQRGSWNREKNINIHLCLTQILIFRKLKTKYSHYISEKKEVRDEIKIGN
jgi:hypothetical protein